MFGVGSGLFLRFLTEASDVIHAAAAEGESSAPLAKVAEYLSGLRGLPGQALALSIPTTPASPNNSSSTSSSPSGRKRSYDLQDDDTKDEFQKQQQQQQQRDAEATAFTGVQFVQWVLTQNFAASMEEAIVLGMYPHLCCFPERFSESICLCRSVFPFVVVHFHPSSLLSSSTCTLSPFFFFS